MLDKSTLIIEFAYSKYQTSLYDGDLSGRTYWEGCTAVYQKLLNQLYPGWGNQGLGKAVWMAPAGGIMDVFQDRLGLNLQQASDNLQQERIENAGGYC